MFYKKVPKMEEYLLYFKNYTKSHQDQGAASPRFPKVQGNIPKIKATDKVPYMLNICTITPCERGIQFHVLLYSLSHGGSLSAITLMDPP